MTPNQYLAQVRDIIDASGTTATTSGRGNGSVKLVTRDDHAAHAFQLHATRAGLKVLLTRPDDASFVLRVTGFRFVPSGPLHTCDRPGFRGACAACQVTR